jgi:hypothetical protein
VVLKSGKEASKEGFVGKDNFGSTGNNFRASSKDIKLSAKDRMG